MNAIELAKEYFPEASEEELDHIIWSRTGFPSFFRGEESIEEQMRKQLSAYKKLVDAGKKVCYLCNSEATRNGLCHDCDEVLNRVRE